MSLSLLILFKPYLVPRESFVGLSLLMLDCGNSQISCRTFFSFSLYFSVWFVSPVFFLFSRPSFSLSLFLSPSFALPFLLLPFFPHVSSLLLLPFYLSIHPCISPSLLVSCIPPRPFNLRVITSLLLLCLFNCFFSHAFFLLSTAFLVPCCLHL